MNIALIGYRATGKTTVAQLLAARLGYEAIDADVEVESRAGKSIARIFAEDGEPVFRDWEGRVIQDLLLRDRIVLAAGGGAPMREENRRALRERATVVWLTARPETIARRMAADTKTVDQRPSLTSHGPLDEVIEVLARRTPVYREISHLEIDTEDRLPEEVAVEILERIRLQQSRSGEAS